MDKCILLRIEYLPVTESPRQQGLDLMLTGRTIVLRVRC